MNERNVPSARRCALPGQRANGNAERARDQALRATAARRLEDERRQRERAELAGVERAGAARCSSEAGRHCWEVVATTTVAVTGTAPGVSTGDTGPCGTGSTGPVRWEGTVTSREGGPLRGRWCEAPFLLWARSSNCGGTRAPRKRTTCRGRGSTATGAQNGLVPGRPVLARDPGPLRRLAPSRRPFRPRPWAARLCPLPQPSPAAPVGPAAADSVFSVSASSAPYGDCPCPSS